MIPSMSKESVWPLLVVHEKDWVMLWLASTSTIIFLHRPHAGNSYRVQNMSYEPSKSPSWSVLPNRDLHLDGSEEGSSTGSSEGSDPGPLLLASQYTSSAYTSPTCGDGPSSILDAIWIGDRVSIFFVEVACLILQKEQIATLSTYICSIHRHTCLCSKYSTLG